MNDSEFFENARKQIIGAVEELRRQGIQVDYPNYIEITRL